MDQKLDQIAKWVRFYSYIYTKKTYLRLVTRQYKIKMEQN